MYVCMDGWIDGCVGPGQSNSQMILLYLIM